MTMIMGMLPNKGKKKGLKSAVTLTTQVDYNGK